MAQASENPSTDVGAAAFGGAFAIGGGVKAELFGTSTLFFFAAQIGTDGAVQTTTPVRLPRNALVETLDVRVKAARAAGVGASAVAQVRAAPSVDPLAGAGLTAVVDFGTPRTVRAISVPSSFQIVLVRTWNGAQFTSPAAYAAPPDSADSQVVLSTEPRTERLSISVVGSSDNSKLIAGIGLILPDPPADLELRIDGQAPAWTHPGPVLAGDSPKLSADAWNTDGERLVHLAPAFAGLTGDPTASGEQTFELKLISRAPGWLAIVEHERKLTHIRRVVFNGRAETTVEFAQEGAIELALPAPGLPASGLPAAAAIDEVRLTPEAAIDEVRLTLEADFGETRTLPPVGPDEFSTVDLTLDPQRAVLVRLQADSGLEKLTGLRLPLAASEEGAEARVVLWSNRAAAVTEPVEAMAAATSAPQTLAAAKDDVPAWTTFPFPAPVPIDADNPPWAAVVIARGRAVLSLTASTGPADPLDGQVFRLGPSGGPWSLPPAALRTGAFAVVRGRVRMTGVAPKKVPRAPLTAEILGAGSPQALDPPPRGLSAVIRGGSSGKQALRLVAYAPGTVTLRNVDLVSKD
jgi:hypothetical protein